MATPFKRVFASDVGAVSVKSAIRRPNCGAAALSWIGRHSAIAVWQLEFAPGVQGAPGGKPTLAGVHPPPLEDEVEDVDVDDVDDVAVEEPVVDAPLPVPELVAALDVDDWPPLLPAADVDDEPPPPVETAEEQAEIVSAGTARARNRRMDEDVFIPGG
jgi:hypothetical protein